MPKSTRSTRSFSEFARRFRFVLAQLIAAAVLVSSYPMLPGVTAARFDSLASPIGYSQDPPAATPSPTPDAVLEQARREALLADELKKKAVADKERAVAENEKLKADIQPLGAANVSIPTGSVQTDAAGWVESQMLAQEAARQITLQLTNKLCTGKFVSGGTAEGIPLAEAPPPSDAIKTLVIYNNSDLTGVELYVTVLGQLQELKAEFNNENPKAVTVLTRTDPRSGNALAALPLLAAPAIATSAIKSVAEVINLFRTETNFQNKSVQISEDMVVSHIADFFGTRSPGAAPPAAVEGSRCSQAVKVYYPALYPPKLGKSPSNSEILKLLNEVEGLKNEAVILLERTDARIKDLTNLRNLLADRKKKADSLTGKETALLKCQQTGGCTSAQIKELKKEIADIKKAVQTIDDDLAPDTATINGNAPQFKAWLEKLTDQRSKLQARITATDLLSAKLNTPDSSTKLTALAQLLRAEKLNSILSDAQTFTLRVAVTANGTTKIKKNIFVDAKVRHSAGANVVYQLFNRDGALAQGDVMQCYIGYRSSRDVENVVTGLATVECKSSKGQENE